MHSDVSMARGLSLLGGYRKDFASYRTDDGNVGGVGG